MYSAAYEYNVVRDIKAKNVPSLNNNHLNIVGVSIRIVWYAASDIVQ